MTSTEPFCHLLGINSKKFSKEEKEILEAELFLRVCEELKGLFRENYQKCFCYTKFTKAMEEEMLDKDFTKLILGHILTTKEYTLEGIARYTGIHEDVIQDLASGLNTKPLASYLRKIIELHRAVRRELYSEIGRKLAKEYLLVFGERKR